MARIRTIKPEFPQSESMGRVSRDARLLFILLWPICDDHGRTRGASRMLASLLYPYDDDAPSLIEGWLCELEREGCIRRYEHEGSTYLEVCNWLNHQKIDRPSRPVFPAFGESSRALASPRESSWLDLRTKGPKDQGPKEEKQQSSTVVRDADHPPTDLPDRTPHADIVSVYHQELPMCPRVRVWDAGRKALLRSRWREDRERQDVDWWREFFRYVARCDFLVGKVQSRDRAPFVADLEWILTPKNFRRIVEGRYQGNAA